LIYCTLLNPALDVVYDLPELKPGTTVTDATSQWYPAGKGINTARVIRTLGDEVTVVGQVPETSHRQFTEFLDAAEIRSHLFPAGGSVRVNTTILEKGNNQVTHINAEGAPVPPRVQDEVVEFMGSRMESGDLWAFSGSLPAGFDPKTYQKLIAMCAKKSAGAMLDSRGEALQRGVRAKPRMIKPNITELEQFFNEQVQGVHHIALKGKRLVDMGVEFVFISLGSDGMIAIHENDCLLCSPPAVKAVDTVGCGDALVAGILVGYVRKFSFFEMCRMAVACGASKAMHRGPGAITRDEIWQLMEDVKVRAI
jgi:1-phosphofructokinase family hexose kinase